MARPKSAIPHETAADDKPTHRPPAPNYPQPRVLGWLILIAGGFSTWYWYRPLPPSAIQAVHGTASQPYSGANGPPSIWAESGLVLPSITPEPDLTNSKPHSDSPFGSASASAATNDRLVGAGEISPLPARSMDRPLKDQLSPERLPMVPVTPPFVFEQQRPAKPSPWLTDAESREIRERSESSQETSASSTTRSASAPDSFESASPFRSATTQQIRPSGTNADTSQWPDASYKPKEVASAKPVFPPPSIPAVLDAGMRKIKTQEDDAGANKKLPQSILQNPPSITSQPNSNTAGFNSGLSSTTSTGRTPVFIKQPQPR